MKIRRKKDLKSVVRGDERGVLLFGIIVVVAILGIMYFKGYILQSTETRRVREVELEAKLSQIRKAFDAAKKDDKFKEQVGYDALDETTSSEQIQERVIGALKNSSQYRTSASHRKMDTNAVYLRQEFGAPLLDVNDNTDLEPYRNINVGWRIAYNRVNSSSFEGDSFLKVNRIKDMSNVSEVNQWWFATTTSVAINPATQEEYVPELLVSVTSTYDPPPETDYSGQRDVYGNRGKYGKNVVRMVVK